MGALVGLLVGAGVGDSVGAPVGEGVGVGVSHTLVLHRPLTQSKSDAHCLPDPHLGQVPPPQSMSVSCSPCWPLLHDFVVGAFVGAVVGILLGASVGEYVAHSRSVFTVGALISYWPFTHSVSVVQPRSDVRVGGAV